MLGVVDARMIARTDEGFCPSKAGRNAPLEAPKNARWHDGYREAAKLQALVPDTQLISVSDRGGVFYEVLAEARDALPKVDF